MCYCNFVPKTKIRRLVCHIFEFKICRDLEIRIRGQRKGRRDLVRYYKSHGQQEKNIWMDSGKSWSNKNFVSTYNDTEIALFWTYHETQLHGKGYHPRNLIRKKEKRSSADADNIVRQRHSLDRHGLRKSTPSNGQQRRTIHGAVNPRIEDDWSQVKSRSLKAVPFDR